MIELTLEDLFAFDEPKPKAKIKGERKPFTPLVEPRRFTNRDLVAPQFLDQMGKVTSKRKDNELVRRTGPEHQVVAAEHRALQRALRFEVYRNQFIMTLWETQQWN